MDKNNFLFEPNTSGIDKTRITPGKGTIDCNYERVWKEVSNASDIAEIISSFSSEPQRRPILNSEMAYLSDFPSKILSYEKLVEKYGKDRYFWDSAGQRLYKFLINSSTDSTIHEGVKPFVLVDRVIIGVDGDPSHEVYEPTEFSKSRGRYNLIERPEKDLEVIKIEQDPSDVLDSEGVEGVYYFNYHNGKYFEFKSNYTRNINNWYYNNIEFSTLMGFYEKVEREDPEREVIEIDYNPISSIETKGVEGVYYYNTEDEKYYEFTSNYTRNIDNWYKDNHLNSVMLEQYDYDMKTWTEVASLRRCPDDPNNIITVVDDSEELIEEDYDEDENDDSEDEESNTESSAEYTIDIDEIDQEIYYCDNTLKILYKFDYGQFLKRVMYSGTVYESPFSFYRKMEDVFLDIYLDTATRATSVGRKVPTKDIFYVKGHPSIYVSNPDENRFYYDTKRQRYYEYSSSSDMWKEIPQDNLLVPQTYFPHTHGSIQRGLSLEDFEIDDCYTKKEVDILMPSIPGYISAFINDANYFNQHQDISGKQNVIEDENQFIAMNSGVNRNRVDNWDIVVKLYRDLADPTIIPDLDYLAQGGTFSDDKYQVLALKLLRRKQDLLTEDQLISLDSGVLSSDVIYWESLSDIIATKATRSNTLAGYGITDAYTTAELESEINRLTDMLNNTK